MWGSGVFWRALGILESFGGVSNALEGSGKFLRALDCFGKLCRILEGPGGLEGFRKLSKVLESP